MDFCEEYNEWFMEQNIITSDLLDEMYEYFFEEYEKNT
jgi:hypothetical protein